MKIEIRYLTRTALLLALTLVIQMMGFQQLITGSLVNLFLFLAVLIVGIAGGVVIGSLTPIIALSRGILPPPLAPMIPFIIVGNISLVIIFGLLKKVNKYLAVIVAAIVKFLILASAVRFFINVKPPIAQAMQFPQLLTALAGGILVLVIAKLLENSKIFQEIDA